MSSAQLLQKTTTSANQTEAIGEHIGRHLRGGEVIELSSDLGGGKTTFTRGLARAAGSSDVVGSPTFTLSKVYQTPNFEIHHFDFYRLAEAGITGNELDELVGDPNIVLVIEWSDIVKDVLPTERLILSIQRVASHEDDRAITINYPLSLGYLLEGLED